MAITTLWVGVYTGVWWKGGGRAGVGRTRRRGVGGGEKRELEKTEKLLEKWFERYRSIGR